MERCPHGWLKTQGCIECVPSEDWRDDYERRVFGRVQARYLPELPERPELDTFHGTSGVVKYDGRQGE